MQINNWKKTEGTKGSIKYNNEGMSQKVKKKTITDKII